MAKIYTSRTATKNYHILRHMFERMRDKWGVFDGFRSKKNYNKAGRPLNKETDFNESLIKWQLELVSLSLIHESEILSIGSLLMILNWCISKQKENDKFDYGKVNISRRAAVNSGWLLTGDLIYLENCNFGEISTE